jgi:hypothetical protein
VSQDKQNEVECRQLEKTTKLQREEKRFRRKELLVCILQGAVSVTAGRVNMLTLSTDMIGYRLIPKDSRLLVITNCDVRLFFYHMGRHDQSHMNHFSVDGDIAEGNNDSASL